MSYPGNYRPAPRRKLDPWVVVGAGVAALVVIGTVVVIVAVPSVSDDDGSDEAMTPSAVTLTQTVTETKTVARKTVTRTKRVTETYTPPARETFGNGVYVVGEDIKTGIYRTKGDNGSGNCYYEVTANLDSPNDFVTNNNVSGPAVVSLKRSGQVFTSQGCEKWEAR